MPKHNKRYEIQQARALSAQIDCLLAGEPIQTADCGELEAAQRLAQIDILLPPVPAGLQQRVDRMLCTRVAPYPIGPTRLRPALWGALITALTLFVLWTLTPAGQTAWARVLVTLKLRQTTVEITPPTEGEDTEPLHAVREPLRDLLAVELIMGRAPALPRALPEGYTLREMTAVSFPDLPRWISQPLYVELGYGPEQAPQSLYLREYRLRFREEGGILSYKQLGEATVEAVDVAGVEGALITLYGDTPAYSIVWERDGLLLELHSQVLDKNILLDIAQTVR